MADHVHGKMDISDHKKTFEGFIKFWVYHAIAIVVILILLAIFNA